MSKWIEVKLYFIDPIARNDFAGVEIHKKEVRNIRMGKDETGYWLRYEIDDSKELIVN